MSKDALRFMDRQLKRYDRKTVSATMEDVLEGVAWKTFDDGPCRCGNEELAKYAKTTERTVRRSLDRAVVLGIILRIPACRGASGGRGRAFDTIYIIGFNDTLAQLRLEQPDSASSWSDTISRSRNAGLMGQAVQTSRTSGPDQPDSSSRAYIENQTTINLQLPPSPNPSRGTPDGAHAQMLAANAIRVFDDDGVEPRRATVEMSPVARDIARRAQRGGGTW